MGFGLLRTAAALMAAMRGALAYAQDAQTMAQKEKAAAALAAINTQVRDRDYSFRGKGRGGIIWRYGKPSGGVLRDSGVEGRAAKRRRRQIENLQLNRENGLWVRP